MGNVNQTSMRTTARTQQTSPLQQQTAPLDERARAAEAAAEEAAYAQPTQAEAKPKEGRGLLGHIGDVFLGGGQAIGDMVKGVANVILHPIQTLKGIGYVITHPASLVNAFVEPYKQAIKDGRPGLALGRGIVEIGSLFVSPSQVVSGAKGVINSAKGLVSGAKGAGQVGTAAAAAGTLGAKGAELSGKIAGRAATAMEKASKLKALGHLGEAAKLEQFGRIMEKAAGYAATGTQQGVARAMKYATWATNAQTVNVATQAGTRVMTMSALAQHSDTLLNAAAKAGGAVASKAGSLAPAYDLPVKLTKNASSAVKSLGLSAKQADTLLAAADDIFKQSRLAGASEKVALEAAKAFMAGHLGVATTDTALSALANTLKPSTKTLLNNSVTLANQFDRTNYITRPLEKGARAIGRPVDKTIVAVNQVAQNVGDNLAQVGDKVSNALGKVGDMRLGDIPRAVGQVATYPFKVTYQALAGAGQAIKNGLAGLANIGDIPLRRIWEAPAEAVGRAISAGAQLVSNLPDVKLGELAQLARPALAASVIGRVSDVKGMDDGGIAAKYGLLDTPENIKAFKAEVASYAEGAIGPETDNPKQVAQLQTILRKIGYDVKPSGTFDEDTALAVIDFKQRVGITQTYRMADGTPAVNEYVDELTAKALVSVAKQQAGVSETEPSTGAEVTGSQVKASLEALDGALGAFDEAKTTAERAKAQAAMEQAALLAIRDLTGYGLSHKDARADVEDKLNEIAAALNERGYGDEDLSVLIAEAQKEYAAPATDKPEQGGKPTRPSQGGKPEQGSKPAKPGQTEQTGKPVDAQPAAPTTYVVKANDNLARIAQQTLGDANRWREIYDLNKQVIGSNPNLILPGQKLQIPSKAAATPAPETKPEAEPAPAPVSKEVEALIKERGIQNDPANVQAFLKEVGEYAARGAIGPDSGSPAVIKQLQTLLARLGYDKVESNGSFDDATGDAVIDFKVKSGLHQTYKLADGNWAVNEYVGEDTAQAMAKAVKELK